MFLFKKLVSRMFFPVPLCLEIIGAGLLLIFLRRRKSGRALILTGFCLLCLLSMRPVADSALAVLEDAHPPLIADQIPRDLRFIVVLGAGHESVQGYPPNSWASSSTVQRVLEGLRIKDLAPRARLVFTGGSVDDPRSNARVMASVAIQLGAEKRGMVVEEESMDTQDHVRHLRSLLQGHKFVLVTSASHMPRAVALFRAKGMNPLPSSTDFRARSNYAPWDYFPSATALENSRRFFYECLGIIWARINGQINSLRHLSG